MAATTDISIHDYAGNAKVFTPSVAVKDGNVYVDTSSTPASPRTLTVKHIMGKPTDPSAMDVHSLSFQMSVQDTASGRFQTTSCVVTLRVPHSGPTLTNRRDLWSFVKDFLVTANIDKLELGGF